MFERYAVFVTFDGAFGARGADWLGHDIASGQSVQQLECDTINLRAATQRPRRYGFHATIKAPFYLAEGRRETELVAGFEAHCRASKIAQSDGLKLSRSGRFLALTLQGESGAVNALAEHTVKSLDVFRAPLSDADIARRNPARLSESQRANLMRWGYPRVGEDFQFHVTLTGPMKGAEFEAAHLAAEQVFTPILPNPFVISHLTLVGQKADGSFQEIQRLPLAG